ncbi:uncharacterized protein EDB91DRAFT_1084286 [Suillus paluster]|uniref:uncharacterized protein n=1 Tax=Suillus paluster TaxID=48578 RepID=UPI001B884996|nr:uncharacterized protein EDB91DRAFT_1084286 [Suillus paluster]KAG1733901.1 hypothetical protein EDB91DRAFT_1084286 [Suillus paluster]
MQELRTSKEAVLMNVVHDATPVNVQATMQEEIVARLVLEAVPDAALVPTKLLKAFNNMVFMDEAEKDSAFKWKRSQIIAFLGKVKGNPDAYNVVQTARDSLTKVVDKIVSISQETNPKPFLQSHITALYQVKNKEFNLETIFDLVGWFFSVTGTSPTGANRENYYYPLACLFCVFWRRLTRPENAEVEAYIAANNEPQKIQMTVFDQGKASKKVTRICIMSNVPGKKEFKTEREKVRDSREDALIADGLQEKRLKNQTMVKPNGQKFGSCAETLPFLFIKSILSDVDAKTAEGFAFKPQLILPEEGKTYKYNKPSAEQIDRACNNCAYLLGPGRLGFTYDNFTESKY